MLWNWATSSDGQTTATWLSAILSFLAIVIALIVALVEQKRANAERTREVVRQREEHEARLKITSQTRNSFISLCVELVGEAISVLRTEIDSMRTRGHSYVTWNLNDGIPHLIVPIHTSLTSLQSVWQDDAKLVLTLSRSVRTLNELVTPLSLGTAPSVERALQFAEMRLEDLVRRQSQFEDYRPH